jgi:ABC-2 type transport system permease protein
MLWYKAWLETRWRFLIGLAVMTIVACGTVFDYPAVAKLMPYVPSVDAPGPMGQIFKRAIEVQRDYRGFIWWQWFRQNLLQLWTFFAILLGSGGLLSTSSGGAALFMLSLPISRKRLLEARAGAGLLEALVLAVVPSLVVPLVSPAIGQTYRIADVVAHGVCLFVVGSMFFALAFLLSTVFSDVWRPLLIACGVAIVIGVCEPFLVPSPYYGVFGAMSGEMYFRAGQWPWLALGAGAVATSALLYGSGVRLRRQDF